MENQNLPENGRPAYYNQVCKMKDNGFDLRLRMVFYARRHGNKATAREFMTTVKTVRKWRRRYESSKSVSCFQSQSRAPKECPHKTSKEVEERVLSLRTQLPTMGAKRMREEFELPCSHAAISRIFHQHGLIPKRRKKWKQKQDLGKVKETWRLFEQFSIDTKDLTDIVHFWPFMKALGLPTWQYTARDVRSGLTFLGFANERCAAYASAFAHRICKHLSEHEIEMPKVSFQSDNGSEFIGGDNPDGSRHGFPAVLKGFTVTHRRIPPAAHTFQSDVETFHRLIEDEFLKIESFASYDNFKTKIQTFQLYFNLARRNSHKRNLSPWEIVKNLNPKIPISVCLLSPIFLDEIPVKNYYTGYDLPWFPSRTKTREST